MKVYTPISTVLTDYEDSEITMNLIKYKRRLEIAVNAWNTMLALRTFKNSKFMKL